MSSENISGIQGNQGKAQTAATATRTAGKKRLMKFAMYFAGFVCLSILWRAVDFGTETQKPETTAQRNSVATVQPNVHETEATWKRNESGAIPVGVWSETFHIKVGCKADYDAGVGTDFRVRYRFYSPEWKDLQPGTWPPTNEAQFMLLRPRTTVPIKVTCS